jgi:hypothetical protein
MHALRQLGRPNTTRTPTDLDTSFLTEPSQSITPVHCHIQCGTVVRVLHYDTNQVLSSMLHQLADIGRVLVAGSVLVNALDYRTFFVSSKRTCGDLYRFIKV